MKNFFLIILSAAVFFSSCSSMGKRTVPDHDVVSKNIILEKGAEEVAEKFGEYISENNIGIYKRGYRNWKVILYGKEHYYEVFISEDGKIISSTREFYK